MYLKINIPDICLILNRWHIPLDHWACSSYGFFFFFLISHSGSFEGWLTQIHRISQDSKWLHWRRTARHGQGMFLILISLKFETDFIKELELNTSLHLSNGKSAILFCHLSQNNVPLCIPYTLTQIFISDKMLKNRGS